MVHAGLDLSRDRLDVCLLSEQGEIVEEFTSPADRDGLAGLVRRVSRHGEDRAAGRVRGPRSATMTRVTRASGSLAQRGVG